MSDYVRNAAGETVATVASDMDAVRWFLEHGRVGDFLDSTGETLNDLAADLMPDVTFTFDGTGQIRITGEA